MKSVDLFSCAGGASLGIRRAGYSHEVLVDVDGEAIEVARAAGFPAIRCDVRAFDRWIGHVTSCDLLWASPDCTVWSSSGKRTGARGDMAAPLFRSVRKDRNGWPFLFEAIDRMRSSGVGPAWVVAENVVGMVDHLKAAHMDGADPDVMDCPGCYFHKVILGEMRKRFEFVDWSILNAADYGVPQSRQRVFIVAGPSAYTWPEPTHADRWVGVDSVICGHDGCTVRHLSNSAGTRGRPLSEPCPTIGTKGTIALERQGELVRRLTQEEESRLQGFPKGYPWHVVSGDGTRRRLSGRAVPPILAQRIVERIPCQI